MSALRQNLAPAVPLPGWMEKTPRVMIAGASSNAPSPHVNDVATVAFSPDGRSIASGGWWGSIDVWNVQTGQEIREFEKRDRMVWSVAFSPDGRYIAFMSIREGYCSVFRMDADGNNQINLTPQDPRVSASAWCSRAPAWSADGQQIYFMSSRTGQNQVYVMNADGSNVQELTSDGLSGSPRARVAENETSDE